MKDEVQKLLTRCVRDVNRPKKYELFTVWTELYNYFNGESLVVVGNYWQQDWLRAVGLVRRYCGASPGDILCAMVYAYLYNPLCCESPKEYGDVRSLYQSTRQYLSWARQFGGGMQALLENSSVPEYSV